MQKKIKLKTLKDWFLEREKEHPEYGAYINMCYTIHHSGADRKEITKAFNELIPKDEYDKEDKKELIDYLVEKAKDKEETPLEKKAFKNSSTLLYSNIQYSK